MESTFDFELLCEFGDPGDQLRTEARTRLQTLASGRDRSGRDDMVGASVALEELTGADAPHVYQARVVAYVRPENVVAVEKAPDAAAALDGAISAVERQIREQRERLASRWRQP